MSRYEVRTYGLSAGLILDKVTGDLREMNAEETAQVAAIITKHLERSMTEIFEGTPDGR